MSLFGDDALSVNAILAAHHYLGPIARGRSYRDEFGVMVFANPSSRRLPQQRWVELVRWCIVSDAPNAGSQQWGRARRWLRREYPSVTTVVSYSDPAAGHTGALYRACNWLWAPTWHRLREPPSGNGYWTTGVRQAVKDRWVFCLDRDTERASLLAIKDEALLRRMPWAQFQERTGGDYRQFASLVVRGGKINSAQAGIDEPLPIGAGLVQFIEGPEAMAPRTQPPVVAPVRLREVREVLPGQSLTRAAGRTRQGRHAGQSTAFPKDEHSGHGSDCALAAALALAKENA